MENKQTEMVTVTTGREGRFRWAAVTAMLLAIGAILRLVSPSIAGVSPNWIIAMYCLAIVLFRPSFRRAMSIGLVAGALCLATSKSVFPYGNLISEPVGALVCACIVSLPVNMKAGRLDLRPALGTVGGTLASGLTFTTLAKIILGLPLQVYLYGMLPVVLTVAAANTVIAQALYYPVAALLGGRAGKSKETEGIGQ
ncbi:tryptophan transporter [Sporomusa termitida]|uniref:Tryptophan transporter TrpP n=1 Tax=Sporomusa termitida TaxID=2377 RepID=A0A517E0N7_9FIRM|nr:tryptophan transporter [Sporomusa termitida]QDR83169.1 Tryptophan transporter TrpP [Sporomusa termitida]